MRRITASILVIGSELTRGKLPDLNTPFIASELTSYGINVNSVSLLPDVKERIVAEIGERAAKADLLITTGGIGPTDDDLSREAIAIVSGRALEENAECLKKLKDYCEIRGRPLNETSRRQAFVPSGSHVLRNMLGSADGFITELEVEGKIVPIVTLPGVPAEVRHLVSEQLLPWLSEHFHCSPAQPQAAIRCFGVSEAAIGQALESCPLPKEVQLAYRPQFPEILLEFHIKTDSAASEDFARILEVAQEQATEAIGREFVFSKNPAHRMQHVVLGLLSAQGMTLAAAESCSGGLLAHRLISVPGASEVLLSSLVCYSNSAKEVYAGVSPQMLEKYGAVSETTTKTMARSVKYRIGADFGLAISGIAGPGGGSDEKPLGTVWIAVADAKDTYAFHYRLPWERNALREYSVNLALDLVRRSILNYPLTWKTR